jgi:hypothetical protein
MRRAFHVVPGDANRARAEGRARDAFDAQTGQGEADHRARLASVEGVLAQACGRPAQTIVGDGEQPMTFVLASLLQRAREEER